LAAGAFVLAVAVTIKYKIPALAKRMSKVEKQSHKQEVTAVDIASTVKKHEIYSRDGTARYQHVDDCRRFQATYCKKIDEMKIEVGNINTQLKGMDKARIRAEKDLVATMTRVEGMIQKDRTQELQTLAEMIVKKTNKNK